MDGCTTLIYLLLLAAPVRIYQMSVSGDILVANMTKWPRQLAAEGPHQSTHLQQYYMGRITLNGSLTVNNLQADTNMTRIYLLGQSLRAEDLHADYLMHSKSQVSLRRELDLKKHMSESGL